MKYIKLFENFEDYDPYELMITPPNKKGEMLVEEIQKREPNLDLVRDLIALGANLDWQDDYGITALHYCGQYDHLDIAKVLIDAGADVNIQHSRGWTPLHIFTFYNHSRIVRMLIDAGADKTIPTNDGRLPYELAKTQELKELLKPFNETINSSITKILNDIKLKFLKETMVDEVWKLNNGYCEDIADYFIDIIGGETEDTYIIDDGWFWDGDKISNLETKTGEYWNVKNLKKYGEPSFGWENLNKLDLHGHVWIFSKGKHYDVETLNGVDNFWDLPIYKRQVANLNLI